MTQAIMHDPCGLGYNNISYVYDLQTKKPYPGICVLPLDLNSNGIIDPEENFFNSLNNLFTAISKVKYPSRNLFLLTHGSLGIV